MNTIKEVLSHVEYLKNAPPHEINEHLSTFQRLGAECKTITEFGVGIGTSTWAFLSTQPSRMRSYDILRQPQVDQIEETAKTLGWDFQYIHQDTTDPNFFIEPCELLFIDAWHTADAVRAELKNAPNVSKYIIFHDIVKYGQHGHGRPEVDPDPLVPGVMIAIEEFLQNNSSWKIKERYENNNGLLVIERC